MADSFDWLKKNRGESREKSLKTLDSQTISKANPKNDSQDCKAAIASVLQDILRSILEWQLDRCADSYGVTATGVGSYCYR